MKVEEEINKLILMQQKSELMYQQSREDINTLTDFMTKLMTNREPTIPVCIDSCNVVANNTREIEYIKKKLGEISKSQNINIMSTIKTIVGLIITAGITYLITKLKG